MNFSTNDTKAGVGVIILIVLVTIFLIPFLVFWLGYFMGWVATWFLSNQLTDGLNLFGMNISADQIPLLAGTVSWLGFTFGTKGGFNIAKSMTSKE